MTALPAYDGITLALGDHAVRLRPTLRAAHRLPPPPDLFRHVADLDLGTIRDIITTAATDRREAEAFLAQIDATPLQAVAMAITAPLILFIGGFSPSTDDEKTKPASDAKPMAWADVVRTLYRRATGWLGWTPDTAWNATPAEISEALAGWIEMQEALHPADDDGKSDGPTTYSAERLAEIECLGHDPAFDRDGLAALKSMTVRR